MKHFLAQITGLFLAAAGLVTTHAANVTFGSGANEFTMDFVEIGDPGNAADASVSPNFGAVADTFYMGTYEVSRDMVTKATAEGGLGIAMADMTSFGGNGADRPATGVSWLEAATFVNWLNTSAGFNAAYKFDAMGDFQLWEMGDAGFDASNPYRNTLANYFLPSVDEWYKAAYYDPSSDTYFDYATGSNTAPTATTGGTAAGTAVYNDFVNASPTGPADITNAGGLSPFGTMGQNGNVFEALENAYDLSNDDPDETREQRGGFWNAFDLFLVASNRNFLSPTINASDTGFRIAASAVPEPSRVLLCLMGLAAIGLRRRRH